MLDKEPYPLDEKWLDKIPYFVDILVEPDEDELRIALEDTLSGKAQEEQDERKFERRDNTKRRGHDDGDEDQPRSKRHAVEDDEDEEPRRSKPARREAKDEEDDQPRRKPARREAEDEEDDQPRRKPAHREENDLTFDNDDRPEKKDDNEAQSKVSKVDELRARLAAKTKKQ